MHLVKTLLLALVCVSLCYADSAECDDKAYISYENDLKGVPIVEWSQELQDKYSSIAEYVAKTTIHAPVVFRNANPIPIASEKWTHNYLKSQIPMMYNVKKTCDTDGYLWYFNKGSEIVMNENIPEIYDLNSDRISDILNVSSDDYFKYNDDIISGTDQCTYRYAGRVHDLGDMWKDIDINPYVIKDSMRDDIVLPDDYDHDAHTQTRVWIGHKGSTSPMHQDPFYNLYTMIEGHKEIILMPPGASAKGLRLNPVVHGGQRSIDRPLRMVDGVGEEDEVVLDAKTVVLGPGEVIYIPPHYFHQLKSLELTVSVSIWSKPIYVTMANIIEEMEPWFVGPDEKNPDIVFRIFVYNLIEDIIALDKKFKYDEYNDFIQNMILDGRYSSIPLVAPKGNKREDRFIWSVYGEQESEDDDIDEKTTGNYCMDKIALRSIQHDSYKKYSIQNVVRTLAKDMIEIRKLGTADERNIILADYLEYCASLIVHPLYIKQLFHDLVHC